MLKRLSTILGCVHDNILPSILIWKSTAITSLFILYVSLRVHLVIERLEWVSRGIMELSYRELLVYTNICETYVFRV